MHRQIQRFASQAADARVAGASDWRPVAAWMALVMFAVWLLLCPAAQAQERHREWTVTDLGTLGGPSTLVRDINARGQIVGQSARPEDFEAVHAFLYEDGAMHDLGIDGIFNAAVGVNQAGVIIANNVVASAVTVFYPLLYRNGAQRKIDVRGSGLGINDRGDAVGSVGPAESGTAALFQHGRVVSLGTLGGTFSIANAINNAGQITGAASLTGNAATHAFLYEHATLRDLGTLGGTFSWAHAINDRGWIVGTSTTADNHAHAFLHDGRRMRDLGTLGGDGRALGINNRGEVVGVSLVTEQGHAFLYRCGAMLDLNTLAAVIQSGWTLTEAVAINDRGEIAANARKSPASPIRGVLLTPPERQQICHRFDASDSDEEEAAPR